MREFSIDKTWAPWIKGSLVVSLFFIIWGLSYPFYSTENVHRHAPIIIAITSFIFFGGFLILGWGTLKKLPFLDIVTDQDGIWYKHIGKERGLVQWHRIAKIKDRNILRCLDLLDSNGIKLLSIQTILNDFDKLAEILHENRTRLNKVYQNKIFSKSIFYHLGYISIFVIAIGVWLFSLWNNTGIYGFSLMLLLVSMYSLLYFPAISSVEILDGSLIIRYPLRKKMLPFSEIMDIRLLDYNTKYAHLVIHIDLKNGELPLKLKNFVGDTFELYSGLREALRL